MQHEEAEILGLVLIRLYAFIRACLEIEGGELGHREILLEFIVRVFREDELEIFS